MTRDFTQRPLTDNERKQNVVFTFVAAYARMYELRCDPNLYESEVQEMLKLVDWWDNKLTEKQRDKIIKCVIKYGSTDVGVPQHKEESVLVLMCTYGRMLYLRSIEKKNYQESEESKRAEYEWALLPESLQFDIVKWVKAYFLHYDHPLMMDQI